MDAPWNQFTGMIHDPETGRDYDGHLVPSKRLSVRDAVPYCGRRESLEAQADAILKQGKYSRSGQPLNHYRLTCLAPDCGASFNAPRPDAKTCSPSCRKRLSRAARDVKSQIAGEGSWDKVQERLAADPRFAERLRTVAAAESVSDSPGYSAMEHSYPVSEGFMNDQLAAPLWGDPDWSNPEVVFMRKQE